MKYFAYGMNTNTGQMAVRCPAAQPLGRAVLYGHEFRFARHADIIPNPDYDTHGVVWEITPECERSLDALEGYPNYYLKKQVSVFYNGRPITCMTYYMTGDLPDELPSDGYLEMLYQGYAEYAVDTNQIRENLDLINKLDQREIDLQARYFPLTS